MSKEVLTTDFISKENLYKLMTRVQKPLTTFPMRREKTDGAFDNGRNTVSALQQGQASV